MAKLAPASDVFIEDLHEAGGVSAALNELSKKEGALHLDALTVTGKTLGETIAGHEVKDYDVIHPLDQPFTEKGGLAVLFGNLAPDGAIIKRRRTEWDYKTRRAGCRIRFSGRGA